MRVKGIVFKVGTVFRLSRGIVFRLFNQTSIQSQRILYSPFLKDQFQTRLSDLQESSEHLLLSVAFTRKRKFILKWIGLDKKAPVLVFTNIDECVISHRRIQNSEYKIHIYMIYSVKVFREIL